MFAAVFDVILYLLQELTEQINQMSEQNEDRVQELQQQLKLQLAQNVAIHSRMEQSIQAMREALMSSEAECNKSLESYM